MAARIFRSKSFFFLFSFLASPFSLSVVGFYFQFFSCSLNFSASFYLVDDVWFLLCRPLMMRTDMRTVFIVIAFTVFNSLKWSGIESFDHQKICTKETAQREKGDCIFLIELLKCNWHKKKSMFIRPVKSKWNIINQDEHDLSAPTKKKEKWEKRQQENALKKMMASINVMHLFHRLVTRRLTRQGRRQKMNDDDAIACRTHNKRKL